MVDSTTPAYLQPDNPKGLALLLHVAADLTQTLPTPMRYERLVRAARSFFPCDAVALLRYAGDTFVPVAAEGLARETLQREFVIDTHPRLRAIADSPCPLVFDADDPRPDPYDGLLADGTDGQIHVHSCLGVPLRVGSELVGVLTMDALAVGCFDDLDLQLLEAFGYLAAAAMQTGRLIAALESQAQHRTEVARELVVEALERHGGLIIGESEPIVALRREIELIAHSDLSVLISGETGTGKELVARTIHALSARATQPLVHINCAALPESIAESELFGHVKGAFTGAVSDRPGKFEIADGGTLFLDEVGELPLSIQAKLLRTLQFGEIQRVGEDQARIVSVRVLAATNRELDIEMEAGRFRPDLYHRLSVYPLLVPPLRVRGDDVVLIAGRILEQCRHRLGVEAVRLSGPASKALIGFDWPGNVRELEHVMLRASLRATRRAGKGPRSVATIERRDLDLDETTHAGSRSPSQPEIAPVPRLEPGFSLTDAADAYQRNIIAAAVEQAGGNWAAASKLLGLDRSNLHRLARRLGLK